MRARSRISRLAGVGLLASALCAGLPSCSSRPQRPRPRLVLLYATCTLNRDYLGPYGEAIAFTPNLDRFASEGVVFRRHETESGQSGISFASLFAGTQSYEHGIYHHPNRLPDELYLITEAFADAGYEPWFWSGHEMAAWDLNYGQGVPAERVFEAKPPRKRAKKKTFLQPGDPLFQRLLDRLEADPDYRAFILVNFTMTHGPYRKQLLPAEYAAFLAAYPALAADITLDDLTRTSGFRISSGSSGLLQTLSGVWDNSV